MSEFKLIIKGENTPEGEDKRRLNMSAEIEGSPSALEEAIGEMMKKDERFERLIMGAVFEFIRSKVSVKTLDDESIEDVMSRMVNGKGGEA